MFMLQVYWLLCVFEEEMENGGGFWLQSGGSLSIYKLNIYTLFILYNILFYCVGVGAYIEKTEIPAYAIYTYGKLLV